MKSNGVVLIVEDEAVTGMCLEVALRKRGYVVHDIATTGEDAVAFARRDMPGVVLMDIRLAGEMDGIEAAQQIRAFSLNPIIFVSGYFDRKTKERAMEIANSRYIEKPVSTKDLLMIIQAIPDEDVSLPV